MDDGQRRCPTCWTGTDKARIEALEFRGLDTGLNWVREEGVAWLYPASASVPARQILVDWAYEKDLEYADHVWHLCLPWLTGRIRDPLDCTVCWQDGGPAISSRNWEDHRSAWMCDGKPALFYIAPYSLTDADYTELRALGSLPDVHVEIRPKGSSWYGFGTHAVEIWAAEAWGSE